MTPLNMLFAVPREGGSAGVIFMVQMVLIFGIFYFLLIRPQAKERQKQEEMLKRVGKGDEVVTAGGIIGRIVHVDENRLTIKTAENTRITIERGKIATVVNPKADPKSDQKEA